MLKCVTYNVEGLLSLAGDLDLAFFSRAFDFVVFVETFVTSVDDSLFPDHYLFLSPAVKVSDSARGRLSGGVIVGVKKELCKYVERVAIEYDSMVALRISKELLGFPSDVIMLGVYIPPVDSPYYKETEITNGITMLEDCMVDIIRQVGDLPFILCGDFNARTGCVNVVNGSCESDVFDVDMCTPDERDETRISKDGYMNAFGKYLLHVCNDFGLSIVNGLNDMFSGDFTYISSTGCSVVDYFIVSSCLLQNCISLSVMHEVESKHMPIILSLISFYEPKSNVHSDSPYKYERFKWKQERINDFTDNIKSNYVQFMVNEASSLLDVDVDVALSTFNEGLAYAGSCMKQVVFIGGERKKRWFDVECKECKKCLRQKLRVFHKTRSNEDRLIYLAKRKEYKDMLKEKKLQYKMKILESIDCHKRDPCKFWSTLRSVRGKQLQSNAISKDVWYDHFKNVFQSDCNETACSDNDVNVCTEEINVLNAAITDEEVQTAARLLKNDKAAGPDGLIGEFYKYAISDAEPFLVKLFNIIFTKGLFPQAWTESIVQPLHKKGDVTSPDNYRGISLLNICSKMYSSILNRRLEKWIEENKLVGEEQAGFRRKYSTIDQIFTLTALVQKQLLRHRKLYAAFIDFRKAFDSVNRNKLWDVLFKSGIKGKMLRALQSMYSVVKAKVRVGGDLTESFLCPRGLKQGEICSPILFSLYINELTKEIINSEIPGLQLSPDLLELLILLFADDVVLVSDTVVGLQRQLNILGSVAERLDLIVNLDKSDIIIFRNGGHISSSETWMYKSEKMNVVNVYKYLGIYLSTRLSYSHVLEDLATRGKRAVIILFKTLWSLNAHSPEVFFKLFDCQVQPILAYGSEVWALSCNLQVIEKVHLFALKRFLGVNTRTPSTIVYAETGRYPLFINLYCRCIKYWLKLTMMDQNRYAKKAYLMLYNLQSQNFRTWTSEICFLLYKYGFGNVWENQGVGNLLLFIKVFKERLIECYKSEWNVKLTSNEKFKFVSSFKQSLTVSHYLIHVKHIQARSALARFRSGVSSLRSRAIRFASTCQDDSLCCPFCKHCAENEVHFMLVCPVYTDLRNYYIPYKYFRQPALNRLALLLANENPRLIINVSLYVYHAMNLRSKCIDTM